MPEFRCTYRLQLTDDFGFREAREVVLPYLRELGVSHLYLSPVMKARLDACGWVGEVEIAAEEGDVVLAHPLLLHSSNVNRGPRPRVMSQPRFDMTEPKRTDGVGLLPVEAAIARARP